MYPAENLYKKSIAELVSANLSLAGVLHYFGICFFQHEQHSLEEVCIKHKVNPFQIISELENWASRKELLPDDLYLHPIEVLLSYLKKKHRFFVRQELPFLSSMVAGIPTNKSFEAVMADMKLMFPLFVDDFIHHIHEEEDNLFGRIELLREIEQEVIPLVDVVHVFNLPSISHMAEAHDAHDDEMKGIRKLTADYSLPHNASLSMKILYHELQKLENELVIHAKIENDLLFPKAIELEKEVKRRILFKVKSN